MRAALYHRHGPPPVLEVADVEDPAPGPGGVLLRVLASSINRLDVEQRRGPAVIGGHTLPHISGMDICGEVVAVAADVEAVGLGERVLVNPRVPCGRCRDCIVGLDGRCRQRQVIGGNVPGGYAELCAVPAAQLHRVPDGVEPVHAAALPTTYSLAWRSLFSVGRLCAGETVVVHGAASGVSTAAIQLAVLAGARVIATARSSGKLTAADKLGADALLTGAGDELVSGVLDATAGRGADLVLDHTGRAQFETSMRCLGQQGRLVVCGATTGASATIDLSLLFRKGLTVHGVDGYSTREFESMTELCFRHRIQPVIDSVIGLDELADAHSRIEAGTVTGKVVVQP